MSISFSEFWRHNQYLVGSSTFDIDPNERTADNVSCAPCTQRKLGLLSASDI